MFVVKANEQILFPLVVCRESSARKHSTSKINNIARICGPSLVKLTIENFTMFSWKEKIYAKDKIQNTTTTFPSEKQKLCEEVKARKIRDTILNEHHFFAKIESTQSKTHW